MNCARIKEEDIVELNVRGARAYARVTKPIHRDEQLKRRVLEVEPLTPAQSRWLPTRFPTSRQVVGHYAKRKGSSNDNGHE